MSLRGALATKQSQNHASTILPLHNDK